MTICTLFFRTSRVAFPTREREGIMVGGGEEEEKAGGGLVKDPNMGRKPHRVSEGCLCH